jgi:hypothetical protein
VVICLVFRSTHASCKDVLTREKTYTVFWSFSENGNFREFCGKRGEFSNFKTGIPGGPAMYSCSLQTSADVRRF